MIKLNLIVFKTASVCLIMLAVFSCNTATDFQTIQMSINEPIGVAEFIDLKYTDSGKVKVNLLSPKMVDYSNRNFQYNEFTNGVVVYLYDNSGKRNKVEADYAIAYKKTNLIDLQGNVVITTHDGRILRADQLYFDLTSKWLFTNQAVEFEDVDSNFNGFGFDSDSEFKTAFVLELGGKMQLKE